MFLIQKFIIIVFEWYCFIHLRNFFEKCVALSALKLLMYSNFSYDRV